MKKRIKRICLIGLVILGAILYSFVDRANDIYNKSVDSGKYIEIDVSNDMVVSQSFVVRSEDLDAVSLKLKLEGNTEELSMTYELVDMEEQTTIAKGDISGENIANSKFYKVEIDKVNNCKNKRYEIILKSNAKETAGNIYLFYTEAVSSADKLKIGNDEVEGALVLRTIYHGFNLETFVVFLIFILYIGLFLRLLYRLFK